MRLPKREEVEQLSKVVHARERMAIAELAVATERRQKAQDRIAELKSKSYEVETFADDGGVLQKWLVWREQELRVRQADLARATADYLATMQRCGRFIAEAKAVDELAEQAKARQSADAAKKHEEEVLLSDLLANDIGDQDV